jgi:hypothetical protein
MYTGKLVIQNHTSANALHISTEILKWNMKVLANMFLEKKITAPI